jgi:hypothetical protein
MLLGAIDSIRFDADVRIRFRSGRLSPAVWGSRRRSSGRRALILCSGGALVFVAIRGVMIGPRNHSGAERTPVIPSSCQKTQSLSLPVRSAARSLSSSPCRAPKNFPSGSNVPNTAGSRKRFAPFACAFTKTHRTGKRPKFGDVSSRFWVGAPCFSRGKLGFSPAEKRAPRMGLWPEGKLSSPNPLDFPRKCVTLLLRLLLVSNLWFYFRSASHTLAGLFLLPEV